MSNIKFKSFLLNEKNEYFYSRISNVLSSLQELEENGNKIGARQQTDFAEEIVNQIRRILHTGWSANVEKELTLLQKIGVAIMNSIEKKDKLDDTISSATDELEKLVSKSGETQNKLGSPPMSKEEDNLSVAPSQGSENNNDSEKTSFPEI